VFFRSSSDIDAYEMSKRVALNAWATTWGVQDRVMLMYACTCKIGSPLYRSAEGCASLESVPGVFIHRDPQRGTMLTCTQGPFVPVTWALATLKASPLLPLHLHDQVAPIPCAEFGFYVMSSRQDHCFPMNRFCSRTELESDVGARVTDELESYLIDDKFHGFETFAEQHGFDDMAVLNHDPLCNCLPDSEQGFKHRERCMDLPHSPIRDWWNGSYPTSR